MTGIAPFEIHIPEDALADLKSRLRNTRWIADDNHTGWEPGPPPEFVKSLCEYWAGVFDWRALEKRINAQPQIKARIDGLDIHAIHRRSNRKDAIPLMLIHGWPGAFIEYLDLCRPLAEPAEDQPAFHPVIPSLPGYGFSTTRPGTTPQKIAAYFLQLMERLGYGRFMVQGGNWGSLIGTEMARRAPDRVVGLHLSSISGSAPRNADQLPVSAEERGWIGEPSSFPHFALLTQKPASPAYGLNDSPAGLAAWIGEKLFDWADNRGGAGPALSPEQMLAIVALYWFTGTIGSAMRLYYEFHRDVPAEVYVSTPTAVALFPKSIAKIPRAWAEFHYNIARWTVFDRGGHFPALEVPDLLIRDIRALAGCLSC